LNKTERKGKTGKGSKQNSESLRRLREAEALLDEVELGDASVAAPFTSRAVSIRCCKDVIQQVSMKDASFFTTLAYSNLCFPLQGRCTLVTMLSIYMILGINCLVNAMVLSKLFLNGVKQGDRQMTILGVAVTALFYFVTRAEPLTTLANVRPPSSVMCLRPLLSILLQCAIHCVGIVFTTNLALSFVDPFDPSLVPDGAFNANPLNTTTFLFTCLATVNTFAANYRGRPFMADLKENKLFYRSLQLCYGTLLILVLEAFPPLNDLFQLSSMPVVTSHITEITSLWSGLVEQLGFQSLFGLTMVIDTVLVYLVARMLR
jgi:cation-transporting ATPase 13A1